MNEKVIFKLSKEYFGIVFEENLTFEECKKSLTEKFDSSKDFFDGTNLRTIVKGRDFTTKEFDAIKDIISKNTGFLNIDQEIKPFDWIANNVEGNTKFYRGTMRCGTNINFDGNVVVMGDVNPGAEIIATGNVIVMGIIKGMVHAGFKGNETAIVCATGIYPTQLRIGNIITIPPEDNEKSDSVIEIAFVKDGDIYITENTRGRS